MQNIDSVFILQPAIVIAVCATLLVYLRKRHGFQFAVLAYSFLAYAGAIALKYIVQIPTIDLVMDSFGQHSIVLGLYYGSQTMFFEVGLAAVVAWYAVKRGRLRKSDAEGYGAGLAFWENAVLLGVLSLLNLVAYYAILSTNSSLAQTVYNQLTKNSPGLFDPVSQALVSVALGTIERMSSIMIHLAWGYLSVMAAVYNRKRLILVAMPMGLVDFMVPFATAMGLALFEAVVFAIGCVCIAVAWSVVSRIKDEAEKSPSTPAPASSPSVMPAT